MSQIYHGCFHKNDDGTNKIILAGKRCLCPTLKPFWEVPEDIQNLGLKTRSQTKRQQRVTVKNYKYFENEKRFHRWISRSFLD